MLGHNPAERGDIYDTVKRPLKVRKVGRVNEDTQRKYTRMNFIINWSGFWAPLRGF